MYLKNNLKWLLSIIAAITLTACDGAGTAENDGVDPQTNPPTTNPPASNVIELIPNASSVKINANNPVDVNSSTVISQDPQKMVLAKDTEVSVDRPLFLDGFYQGMIDSVETNADDTITVTFRDAEDLAEILDTLSIIFDTSEGVITSNTSGSPTQKLSGSISGSTVQKLSAANISLYDKQNTKNMSYSLRNAKSTEGKNEPVLRIDIPSDYKIPVAVKNSKIDCSLLDGSCEGNFDYEEGSSIDLGESTTVQGITFSTEGSYVEIGLGMYLNLFADINRFEDDILRFTLKESAYFESNLKASITGSSPEDSENWKKVIPLTEVITVNIPVYGKIVTAQVGLQPYIIVGVNGEITGELVISSYMLRKGDITLSFDSEMDGEDKLQTSKSVSFDAANVDEHGVEVDIDVHAIAFASAGIQLIPSISLANILDIDIGDIRGEVYIDANIVGEIDAGFDLINYDNLATGTNLGSRAHFWLIAQPRIDYKLNIGINPIGLDPISFYSQSDYTRLYTGWPTSILDWSGLYLGAPQVIVTAVNSDTTHVTFDTKTASTEWDLIKPFIKYYYTIDGSDPIESSAILWDGSAIVITAETTIKVKAILYNSDYNTSLWSFGRSISMTTTRIID